MLKSLLLYLAKVVDIDNKLAIRLLIEIVKDSNNSADAQALMSFVAKLKARDE